MSQDPNSASYCDDTTIDDDCKAHTERERLERELAAMTAERDALVQTSGTLCPHCGWRGLRGDPEQCAFCQNAKLSADVFNLRNAKELAERQVAVLIGRIADIPDDESACVCCPANRTGCLQHCKDAITEWSHEQAVKEGGKG